MNFILSLVGGFEGCHDQRGADVGVGRAIDRAVLGDGFALADQVAEANMEVVWGFALVEKVVLQDADREGLILLLEVGGDFHGYAGQFIAACATEDAVEALLHLGEELEADVEVVRGDFQVVAEGERGDHAEFQDLHGF